MEKNITVFSVHRKLILLAKFCLDLLSDLKEDNEDRKGRLEEVLKKFPDSEKLITEIINLYDPLSDEFLNRGRKRILDKANELSREFESDFNKGIR